MCISNTYTCLMLDVSHVYEYGVATTRGWPRLVPSNYRSLLQNIVSFIGLFCKRDL